MYKSSQLLLVLTLSSSAMASNLPGEDIPRVSAATQRPAEDSLKALIAPEVLGEGENRISTQYVMDYFGLRSSDDIRRLEWEHGKDLTNIFDHNFLAVRQQILANKDLKELNLTNRRLKALPMEIGQMHNLTFLNLDGNNLKIIPKSIDQLKNLKDVSLDHNQFTEIPEEIMRMPHLTTLSMKNNQLITLPVDLNQMKSLQYLNVSGNHLWALPFSLLTMKDHLKILDISHNEFVFFVVTARDKPLDEKAQYKDGFANLRMLIKSMPGTKINFLHQGIPDYVINDEEKEWVKKKQENFDEIFKGGDYQYMTNMPELGKYEFPLMTPHADTPAIIEEHDPNKENSAIPLNKKPEPTPTWWDWLWPF